MAKKFLTRIEQPVSEEVLSDLFTPRKSSGEEKNATEGGEKPSVPGSRRKRFLKSINSSLEKQENSSSDYTPASERRFLDAMEDALNDQAFDNIFPARKQSGAPSQSENHVEIPFSLMISEKIFSRAKQIALTKGIRVKDVINLALERYIEQVKS